MLFGWRQLGWSTAGRKPGAVGQCLDDGVMQGPMTWHTTPCCTHKERETAQLLCGGAEDEFKHALLLLDANQCMHCLHMHLTCTACAPFALPEADRA